VALGTDPVALGTDCQAVAGLQRGGKIGLLRGDRNGPEDSCKEEEDGEEGEGGGVSDDEGASTNEEEDEGKEVE